MIKKRLKLMIKIFCKFFRQYFEQKKKLFIKLKDDEEIKWAAETYQQKDYILDF